MIKDKIMLLTYVQEFLHVYQKIILVALAHPCFKTCLRFENFGNKLRYHIERQLENCDKL